MSRSATAVIECGAGRVALAQFRRAGAAARLEDFAEAALPGSAAGGAGWRAGLGAALVELHGKVGPAGPVTVIVPGHLLLAKHVATPRLPAGKRERLIRFEAAQAIPVPLGELVWTHVASGDDAVQQHHLLLAARSEALAELFAAVAAAGFELGRALPEPLAVLAALRAEPGAEGRPRLALHLGGRTATILWEEPAGFRLRLVALASEALMRAGTAAASTVAVEGHALRLAREVERTLLAFERQGAAALPAEVVLTGEAGAANGLAEALAGRLRLPVRPWTPCGWPGAPAGAPGPGGRFLEALSGAAAIQFGLAGPGADLLPPRLRRQMGARRRRRALAVAAGLLLGAILLPVAHYRRVGLDARRSGEAIRGAVAALQAQEAANGRDLRQLAELRRQREYLRELQVRRVRWLAWLGALERRLAEVEGVVIERLRLLPEAGGAGRVALAGGLAPPGDAAAEAGGPLSARASALLAALQGPPRLATIEGERFLPGAGGALGFEFALVPAWAEAR